MNCLTQNEEVMDMEAVDIREQISEYNPEAILWDGLDSCIIGMSTDGRAIYSLDSLLNHFQIHEDMSEQDAREHIDYNIVGAYVGEYTPIHMHTFTS